MMTGKAVSLSDLAVSGSHPCNAPDSMLYILLHAQELNSRRNGADYSRPTERTRHLLGEFWHIAWNFQKRERHSESPFRGFKKSAWVRDWSTCSKAPFDTVSVAQLDKMKEE